MEKKGKGRVEKRELWDNKDDDIHKLKNDRLYKKS